MGRAYLRAADVSSFCTPADGVVVQMIYCTDNGRILLANLFPRDTTRAVTSDSPGSWTFNGGICKT